MEGRPFLGNQNLLAQWCTPRQVPKMSGFREGILPGRRVLAVIDGLCFIAILLCDLVKVT